jgi:hypothetical protein
MRSTQTTPSEPTRQLFTDLIVADPGFRSGYGYARGNPARFSDPTGAYVPKIMSLFLGGIDVHI